MSTEGTNKIDSVLPQLAKVLVASISQVDISEFDFHFMDATKKVHTYFPPIFNVKIIKTVINYYLNHMVVHSTVYI